MAAFLDGCRFNPAAGGTTDWTFSSAVTGYQSPASANAANGGIYKYRAESADLSQWEFGEGTWNSSTGVLTRTTILFTSAGSTSKINFSTVPQIAIVALAEDLNKPPSRASLNAGPFSPTGFSSTTGKMSGLGGTCALTPTWSGCISVDFNGLLVANSGQACFVTIYYGTGTAPANGAALTGTIANAEIGSAGPGTTSITDLFASSAVITGLTPGTAYWFDLRLRTSGATSQSIASVQFRGVEF